jgi:glycerol-3-phosphate cytidylyltransferase
LRPKGGVVGYVPGAFDMFHIGHLNLLRRARLECDYLIAGVVSDAVALEQKGRQPVIPEDERIEIVGSIRFVDEVHMEQTTDKFRTWEIVRFDVVFKGDDWQGSAKWTELATRFEAVGVRVEYLPYTPHASTSERRQQLD